MLRLTHKVIQKRPSGGVFLYRRSFWQWVGWALLACAWLNASHYRPWVNFQSESMALGGLIILALAISVRMPDGARHLWPHSAVAVMAAISIPVVHWITNLTPFGGDAFVSSLYLWSFATAITIGFNLTFVPTEGRGTELIPVPFGILLWAPALASAAIGLLQWLDYSTILGTLANHGDIGERPMGNVAQTNQLATLLLMGMAGAWFDFERQRIGRIAFLLLIVFLTIILTLTQSRTGLLSATMVAGFLILKLKETCKKEKWRLSPLIIGTWIISTWVVFIIVPTINNELLIGGNRNIALLDPNSRQVIWKQLVYAIIQNPWVGYGWNQTAAAHNVGALAHPGDLTYNYAHNFALDIVAWCGLPVGVVILAMLAWWLVTRGSHVYSPKAVASFAALIPFAVHSQLEFPFAYAYFLVLAGVLVGIVEAEIRPKATATLLSTRFMAISATIFGLAGVYAVYEYILAEEDFRIVRFEGMRIGSTPLDYTPPDIHLLTQLGAMLRAARIQPQPGMSEDEIILLHRVALRFPYGALGYRYAIALAVNNDTNGAIQQLKTMHGMYGNRYYNGLLTDMRQKQEKDPSIAEALKGLPQ